MNRSAPQSLLVVLDCDSTLIQDEVIDLLAAATGTADRVSEVTERAMRGEIDFVQSLRERAAMLSGAPEEVFPTALAQVRVTAGARELIAETQRMGGKVGVVSGGFHEVLDPLAEELGVDVWRANRLEVRDGKLTGNLVGPIIDGDAKAAALRDWAEQFNIPMSSTIAIGDGANDLPMMEASALSVAFNAKPIVNARAQVRVEDDLSRVIPLLSSVTATSEGAV